MTAPKPCTCWQQVNLHDGHCCFRYPTDQYHLGQPAPCGHLVIPDQPTNHDHEEQ